MKIAPRGDRLLVRSNDVTATKGGLLLPDGSTAGVNKTFNVEAVGPKVEGVKVGDVVMLTNIAGAAFTIEGEKGLFVVDEKCVLAVVSKE